MSTRYRAPSRRLKILLVEDNEINRTIVGEMIQAEGHQVTLAHNGCEGLRQAQEDRFDLILMDINMPGMNGLETTIQIRKTVGPSQNAAILGLTAHALPSEIENFISVGMQHCLIKPLQIKVLKEVLSTFEPYSWTEKGSISLIDHNVLLELSAIINRGKFSDLLGGVIKEIEETRALLKGLILKRSYNDVAKYAHRMAGSSAVVGALALQESATALEAAAKRPNRDGISNRFSEFEAKSKETTKALKEYRYDV